MSQRYQLNLKLAISILFALFPILSIAIQGGSSAILVLLFLLGLVFAWPAWREISPAEKRWMWSLLVFTLVIAVSFIVDADWSIAHVKVERFARLLAIIPIYLLLRRFKPELLKPALLGTSVAIVILFYQSITLYNVGDYGVSGIYYRIFFGDAVVLFSLWIALGMSLLSRDKRVLALGAVIVVMGLYATVVSMCRNAWMFFPVLALSLLYLFKSRVTLAQIGKVSGVLLVLALVLVIWTPPSLQKGLQKGINSYHEFFASTNKDSSVSSRIKLWHDSLIMAKQHPLLGVGVGNFENARQRMIELGKTYQGKPYGHAHNIFLHALATTGILGLVTMFAALFVMPWRLLYNNWLRFPADPWLQFSLLGGLLSLLAFVHFGLTETWTARNPFINVYVLSTVMFVAATFNRYSAEEVVVSNNEAADAASEASTRQQHSHNS